MIYNRKIRTEINKNEIRSMTVASIFFLRYAQAELYLFEKIKDIAFVFLKTNYRIIYNSKSISYHIYL